MNNNHRSSIPQTLLNTFALPQGVQVYTKASPSPGGLVGQPILLVNWSNGNAMTSLLTMECLSEVALHSSREGRY